MSVKKKILTGLVVLGVMSFSSAAFAGLNVTVNVNGPSNWRPVAQVKQLPELPEPPKEGFKGDLRNQQRPPELPKDGKRPLLSGDKKFGGDKMPPRPGSGDRMPQDFPKGNSNNKPAFPGKK